ncbi:restriction endonuclease subunit S, partial [Staphylococcus aureus]|uniref:restriction endonuclease subunit S n=1 Tax=Staphylococcus aureus TaxID=1280 RepID=UPI00210A7119
NLKIFTPTIFEEQQKIGEFISKLDRQIDLEEQKLELLQQQKKGYMQKIFSSELSPGILFSMIRKDGMLLFNLHQGALLPGMTATQLLLLVFFRSTFTACSVTMTMLLKHLGGQSALNLIGKQMVPSLYLV